MKPRNAARLHEVSGPSNSIDFGGMTVTMNAHGVEFRIPFGPELVLQSADLQDTLNWLAAHGHVGVAR